ncbi:MAG: FtsQ-type POTRA domain-containing protein [Acidobacteria bacterium]|nr:FtsQ-type POTRA domain-containing protein [Acidobacteriota bacterium]
MAIDVEFEEQHLIKQKKRDIKRNREGRSLWIRFLFMCARTFMALLLAAFGVALYGFVIRSGVFNLTEVQILGNSRANETEIRRVLSEELPRNLYRIRLGKVREFIEAQSWVQTCLVRRVFPSKLAILLVERQPVALARMENELFLVDRQGVVLELYGPRFQHLDLPVVRGLENSTQENVSDVNQVKMETVMRLLMELDSGAERLSDKISEIDVTESNRVAVVPLNYPIKVFLGDSNYRERYQTYLSKQDLMADLTAKYGAMDSVDLSMEHRIIFHTKSGGNSTIPVKDDHSG